jgi:hypothetical protein
MDRGKAEVFSTRLRPELKAELARAARINGRSLGEEIRQRLERSAPAAIRFGQFPDDDAENLAEREDMRCLAVAILLQQAAGFGSFVDLRQASCPDCGAAGFNTGLGYWRFACGAETTIPGDGEGDITEPCGRAGLTPVERKTAELADRLIAIVAGARTEVAWRAAQDLFTAIIAIAADTEARAAELAGAAAEDLRASVVKNWSWYRQQVEAGAGLAERRA